MERLKKRGDKGDFPFSNLDLCQYTDASSWRVTVVNVTEASCPRNTHTLPLSEHIVKAVNSSMLTVSQGYVSKIH